MTDPLPPPAVRARREADYYDRLAGDRLLALVNVDTYFHAYTALENKAALDFLGPDFTGKRLLDVGCGYGEASAFFAKEGAQVDAVDISEGMLKQAAQLASHYNVAVAFHQTTAERLPFPDATFDRIYGFGVLHHLPLPDAIHEIRRVLKPSGRAAFVEPLPLNPLVNIYRRMATKYRTVDERPLTSRDVQAIVRTFASGRVETFWFLGLWVFCYMYVIERVHPNDAPYWKKVIYDSARYERWLKPLLRADRFLTSLPGIRTLCYSCVLKLEG